MSFWQSNKKEVVEYVIFQQNWNENYFPNKNLHNKS